MRKCAGFHATLFRHPPWLLTLCGNRRKGESRALRLDPPPRTRSFTRVTVVPPILFPSPRSAAERLTRLRDQVRAHAENRPGVYRMIGPDGEILYVGKSIRVRTRLLSYFRAKPGEKAADLMGCTMRLEWEDMADEFSAILNEMKLIQRFRPRFNVEHKRRRRFAFAKITAEPAPRIILVGRIQADGAHYFGPFPSAGRIQEALRELAHALGLRDCASTTPLHFGDQLELLQGHRAPLCLRAELGSCLAPCAGGCSEGEYRERVERARAFLEGRGTEPFAALEAMMRTAAARHEYEYATVLRDRSARLRALQEELVAFRGRVESLSFVYRPKGYEGAKRLYLIRKGRIRATLPHPRGRRQRLRAVRTVEKAWIDSAVDADLRELQPDDAAEIFLVARWFRRNPEEWRRTVSAKEFLEGGATRSATSATPSSPNLPGRSAHAERPASGSRSSPAARPAPRRSAPAGRSTRAG